MQRLVSDLAERKKINLQLVDFHFARGLFSIEDAKEYRKLLFLKNGGRCLGIELQN